MAFRVLDHEGGEVLGELVLVGGVLGRQHLVDARHRRRLRGDAARVGRRDEQVHLAADLGRGRDHARRRRAQLTALVLGQYQDAHLVRVSPLEGVRGRP